MALPMDLHAALREARKPLLGHDLTDGHYRRWAAAACAAEAEHARDDFWASAHRLGVAALFDRDPSASLGASGFGDPEAPYRFAHEVHAGAALSWLSHLQAHEADRIGPWSAVRWQRWDAQERRAWLARRKHLWSGFVRQVERYRAARLLIEAPALKEAA